MEISECPDHTASRRVLRTTARERFRNILFPIRITARDMKILMIIGTVIEKQYRRIGGFVPEPLDISRGPQYLFIENDSQIGMDIWEKTETTTTDTATKIPAAARDRVMDRARDSDPDREALPDRDRVRAMDPEDLRGRDMVQASRMVPGGAADGGPIWRGISAVKATVLPFLARSYSRSSRGTTIT
jgi:hypothetical protein